MKPQEREGNNGKVRAGYSKPKFELREKGLQKWGLRGRKASPFRAGMDSPLI
jgi:hypothetical protein